MTEKTMAQVANGKVHEILPEGGEGEETDEGRQAVDEGGGGGGGLRRSREERQDKILPQPTTEIPAQERIPLVVDDGASESSTNHLECKDKNTNAQPDASGQTCCLPKKCCGSPVFSPFCRQLANVLVACLAGLCVGTIHAFPAVSLPRWEEAGFVLTTAQTTWFASTPMVISVLTCWGSGIVVEYLGNRKCLMIGVVSLALSWIVIAIAESFWALLLGRILQGLTASVYMVIITVYPAEVSISCWRGVMTGISEAMVMLGAFLTYLAGISLQPSAIGILFILSLIPMLVAYYFLRDSPLWLARQDKDEEVASTLRCLRGPTIDITEELEQIKDSVATERIQKPSATEQLLLLRKMIYFKPVLLSVLVLLFKELTGQYAAMAYTVKIFKMAGSSLDPYWCAVVMGAARFLPCFTSWILIERLPRRLLICTCMTLASFALGTLGTFLFFWSKKTDGLPPSLGWIPLLCFLVFTLVFGSGIGPTCWTLVAELLPSRVRNVGAGIINTCFSLFLFLVGLSFPFMVEGMGIGLVFITYSACTLSGVVFVLVCLPETKGMSFTEIQTVLTGNKYKISDMA